MDNSGPSSSNSSRKTEGKPSSKAKNCAECRRLKIRCDRQIPCSNCVKRGAGGLCPNGQLMSKGQRLLFANTEEMYARIEELTARIEELEDALAKLQALHSDETHPLLAGSKEETLATAFGTLKLQENGTKRFYGPTSSVEWVMSPDTLYTERQLYDTINESASMRSASRMPPDPLWSIPDLATIDAAFPLPMGDSAINLEAVKREIVGSLPSKELALELVNIYYNRGLWEMAPVPREELFSEYFGPCYSTSQEATVGMQDLGLIYAVFSNALIHAPERPKANEISWFYMSLSRACLTLDSVVYNTTLTGLKTLLLHISYYHTSDVLHGGPKAQATLGIAMQPALSIGLHRDPSMWNLPDQEAARRRLTMWELVTSNLWVSLVSGRPPLISRRHFDVKLPFHLPDVSDPDPNFHRGRHHFSSSCLWDLLDLSLAPASKSNYSATLKLDTKIRTWSLPRAMHAPLQEIPQEKQRLANFREVTGMVFREICLMCLHRVYFARALLEPPFDPLSSIYSRSVLAVYASACSIVKGIRLIYEKEPVAVMKYAFFWTQAFSSAAVLATIAIRAPDCPLAKPGMVEFDSTLELFEREKANLRACGLPTLLRLQAQAQESLERYKNGMWNRPTTTDSELFLSLGAAGSVLKVPKPVLPFPQNTERDVMASLGQIQPEINTYLRYLDRQSVSESSIFTAGPSSDAFLYGVVRGHEGASASASFNPSQQPFSDPGFISAPTTSAQYTKSSFRRLFPPTEEQYPDQLLTLDTGSSSQPMSDCHPPTEPAAILGSQASLPDTTLFHWDNFLQEFGIPNSNL